MKLRYIVLAAVIMVLIPLLGTIVAGQVPAVVRRWEHRGHRKMCEEWVRQDPGDARAVEQLAQAYLMEGRFQKAMEAAERAVALESEDVHIWYSYVTCAWLVARHEDDPTQREAALAKMAGAAHRTLELCEQMNNGHTLPLSAGIASLLYADRESRAGAESVQPGRREGKGLGQERRSTRKGGGGGIFGGYRDQGPFGPRRTAQRGRIGPQSLPVVARTLHLGGGGL